MPIRKDLGNDLWIFMHSMAEISQKKGLLEEMGFLEKALITLLPCIKCRAHYLAYQSRPGYKKLEPDKVAQLIDIHNEVNKLLGKKKLALGPARRLYVGYVNDSGYKKLKPIFTRIILTYADHWNNTRWKKKLEIKKIKHLRRIVFMTMKIWGTSEDKANKWWNGLQIKEKGKARSVPSNPWEYGQVYDMVEDYNITFKYKRGYTHNTKGCDCHNK